MINQITSTPIKQHMYPQRERSDIKVDDQVSKPTQNTSLSTESSQRIVNDKIIEKLDKVLQKNHADEIRTLDPKNYTPESVSKQILNFVKGAIDRAEARGTKFEDVYNQARKGIDKGFAEAENILISLNALSGKIAEGVQKTYELINQGMEEIVDNFQSANGKEASNISASAATSNQSQSFSLNVTTAEGDTVDISLQTSSQSGAYNVNINGRNGAHSQTTAFASQSSSQFSLSVNGDLNNDELEAIDKLLSNVKDVSDKFFSGDVNSAFNSGLKLGFDAKELVGFSLEVNQNFSSSTAKIYREIDGFTNTSSINSTAPRQQSANIEQLLSPIKSFSDSLGSTIKQAEQSATFQDSKQAAEQLFNYLSRSNNQNSAAIQQLEILTTNPFEKVSADIFSVF